MPRPTHPRRSLPGHSKAASRTNATRSTVQDDDLIALSAGDELMKPIGNQVGKDPIKAPSQGSAGTDMQGHDDEGDDAQVIPQRTSHCFPSKPTKALKQHLKRQALLEKITSSQQPYSKSHARRLKRASKPENNLVSDLKQVESALPVVSETTTTMGPEDALGMNGDVDETVEGDGDVGKEQEGVERFVGTLGSQGNEKLTAKKRSRVLYVPTIFNILPPKTLFTSPTPDSNEWVIVNPNRRSEASRLPAVLTNKEFKKDAFAAIRLHMMNQIKAEKQGRTEQGKKKKKGNK